ncbi:hypothetical protein FRX31_013321 [Thalictrum thalictroides]|uniref:Uncharacterized protein n=1 Tax=Thalictrum thalictroides TaxID=46969 RepID=A0A7J6WLU9_THATH|nr:hypothetical protein FRX31_013321 [Thalictrum thalictroides]
MNNIATTSMGKETGTSKQLGEEENVEKIKELVVNGGGNEMEKDTPVIAITESDGSVVRCTLAHLVENSYNVLEEVPISLAKNNFALLEDENLEKEKDTDFIEDTSEDEVDSQSSRTSRLSVQTRAYYACFQH